MTYSEIHIWGDSLARSVIYNEEKGRYAISRERFTERLQSALGRKVENHSNMGATVADGLESFRKFRAVPGALCAIEFGGNDCDLDWRYVSGHPDEPIVARVPLDDYREQLAAFIREVRLKGMRPLLVTPLPLHAQRYFDWVTRGLNRENVLRALGDVCHIYRWQERYSIAMRDTAAATGCGLLDMRDAFLALPDYERLMCVDGIHPNDEGHRAIADAVIRAAMKDEGGTDLTGQPGTMDGRAG